MTMMRRWRSFLRCERNRCTGHCAAYTISATSAESGANLNFDGESQQVKTAGDELRVTFEVARVSVTHSVTACAIVHAPKTDSKR
jgi:hypothetical protein